MNKKHCLILGAVSLILSILCFLMSIFTKNDVDPLNINIAEKTVSEYRADSFAGI